MKREIRGPIKKSDLERLVKNLINKFKILPEVDREIAIFFDSILDLRIKINSNNMSIILPRRSWYKNTIEIRKEKIIDFKIGDIDSIIKFLNIFGLRGGCYISPASIIKFAISKKSAFILKLNTKVGCFYEIEFYNDFSYKQIINLLKCLKLKFWTDLEYKNWLLKSWGKIKRENLNSLFKNYWNDFSHMSDILYDKNKSIKDILEKISNNYSEYNNIFYIITKKNLWTNKNINLHKFKYIDFNISASIIIPAKDTSFSLSKTLESINNNIMPKQLYSQIEIIVVDDGTCNNSIEEVVNIYNSTSRIKAKYVRIQNNAGRNYARNIGASLAAGEILFFIDSDIILGKNYLFEHLLRHFLFKKICLVSFKRDIYNFSKFKIILNRNRPQKFTDFRVKKLVNPNWIGIYPSPSHKQILKPLESTKYFMNFGCRKNIGIWDLSCMVTTSNLSIRREEFIKIGGFHKLFKGWGFEDTFLGSCLIANGNFIIPVLSTGVWHFCYKKIDKEKRYKSKMFKENLNKYKNLINKSFHEVIK